MLGMKCAPCFAVGKWGQIPTNASDDFLHQLGQLSLQGGSSVLCSITPAQRLLWSLVTNGYETYSHSQFRPICSYDSIVH